MAEKNKDYELETMCEYTSFDGGRGWAIKIKNKKTRTS